MLSAQGAASGPVPNLMTGSHRLKYQTVRCLASNEVVAATWQKMEMEPGTAEMEPGTAEMEPGTVEIETGTVEMEPGTAKMDPGTVQMELGTAAGPCLPAGLRLLTV